MATPPTADELYDFINQYRDDPAFEEKLRGKFPTQFSDEDICNYLRKAQLELGLKNYERHAIEMERKKNQEVILAHVRSLLEMKEELRPVVNMIVDMVYDRIRSTN